MSKNPKVSAALNFISTFCVSIIVLIAIALVAARLTGLQGYSVKSNSMAPTYPINSFVFVKKTSPAEIEVGDVITYVFNDEGLLVTHRVTAIDSEHQTFTTKGDNNNIQDPNPVLWGNVIGKAIFSIPKAGIIMGVLTDNNSKPYIIAAVVLIGLLNVTLDLLKKKENKTRQKSIIR